MGYRPSRCVLPKLRTLIVYLDRRPHNVSGTVLTIQREDAFEQRGCTRHGNLLVPPAAQGAPPQGRWLAGAKAAALFQRAIPPAPVSEKRPRFRSSRRIY